MISVLVTLCARSTVKLSWFSSVLTLLYCCQSFASYVFLTGPCSYTLSCHNHSPFGIISVLYALFSCQGMGIVGGALSTRTTGSTLLSWMHGSSLPPLLHDIYYNPFLYRINQWLSFTLVTLSFMHSSYPFYIINITTCFLYTFACL